MTELSVRPMLAADIPDIVRYWSTASTADLERMGVDAAKMPDAPALAASLLALMRESEADSAAFYSVWLVDGKGIGYSSLKDFQRGGSGGMHLHMWSEVSRGQGLGGRLFCLSAVDFYRRFALKSLFCEPKATNPMPNRMLQKLGFPLVKTYTGASSALSAVCELNRYEIPFALAERGATPRSALPSTPTPAPGARAPAD